MAKNVFFCVVLFSALSVLIADEIQNSNPGLVMKYYRNTCPQAEHIIKEQVRLLYERHENTAFFWLTNIFHDCFVESCDGSLLLDSTRKTQSEKETDRSFGSIKVAVERECPGVVSCADILVLSARDAIVSLGGPYIPLKTGRRDGRTSRSDSHEKHLPDHNESMSVVLERFANIGINTPGVVALLGAHIVQAHCVKLVHRIYHEVDPQLNPYHVPHMLKKCPDTKAAQCRGNDRKGVQCVRDDRGTPMKLDNNYYKNILDNNGLMSVDHQLAVDKRTRPFVKKMAKSQDYFFREFARAITILSENNPLTGTKGEIRKQCHLGNKLH